MDFHTIIHRFQTNIKANPQNSIVHRIPFFYGWIIFAVGTLGQIMASPGLTFSVSVFIDHFIQDLQISRSLVSSLYTMGTILGSLALPVVGRLIDRFGPRAMMTIVSLLFGLTCIYMGWVQNAFMLALGFIALRMLGQSSMSLVCVTTINLWWVKRRGTILGISGLLIGIGGLGTYPNLIQSLINFRDWRFAYFALGFMLLSILLPLGALLFRSQPEKYGLQPDGVRDVPPVENTIQVKPIQEVNFTLREALHSPIFWVMALGVGTISMYISGQFFHMVSIFQDNNLPAELAASTFIPVAIASAVFNMLSGMLVDKISLRYLMITSLVGLVGLVLLAQRLTSYPLAYLYGSMIGFSLGVSNTISSVSWAKFFGRKYLGSIMGISSIIMVIGSALGPMPLGIARDLMGSYNPALNYSLVIPATLILACLFVRPPKKIISTNPK